MNVSTHQFPQVYTNLGIDISRLGCIMLDTQPIVISEVVKEADYYVSEKDGQQYVKGNVSEDVPHVTLLYGLMRSGQELQQHVDAVLSGWELPDVAIDKVDFFYSKDPDEHYIAIIALVEQTPDLLEANARLRLLPHIDTFADYKPHITLAYVKDTADWQGHIEKLNSMYAGTKVRAVALNYGD